ncbi:MAG: hypothetical protein JSV49_00320 [Thermoplasmata archaeon]|nr:MAG: hypothetical protein JSV49_00320 [Thermoplasmata archaeon]
MDIPQKTTDEKHYRSAITKLNSLIREVKAQNGKKITADQAEHLVSAAKKVIFLIQRKLDTAVAS